MQLNYFIQTHQHQVCICDLTVKGAIHINLTYLHDFYCSYHFQFVTIGCKHWLGCHLKWMFQRQCCITADAWTNLTLLTTDLALCQAEYDHRESTQKKSSIWSTAKSSCGRGNWQHPGWFEKVLAATVDNSFKLLLHIPVHVPCVKMGCFAHNLNLAAQKIHQCNTVSNLAARIRTVDVWMKRFHMIKMISWRHSDSSVRMHSINNPLIRV